MVLFQCGNNPFCLAVRGFHDFLAGFLLSKLRAEDKMFFCKVCTHRERERKRDRERDRERERGRQTDRKKETDGQEMFV